MLWMLPSHANFTIILGAILCVFGATAFSPVSYNLNTYRFKAFCMQKQNCIRPVGGYEKLLNRKIPGSNAVALSHGAVYLFDGDIDEINLMKAVTQCISRHPMLRSFIEPRQGTMPHPITGDDLIWVPCEEDNPQLAQRATEVRIVSDENFNDAWKNCLERSLNAPEFPSQGPLWRLTTLRSISGSRFSFVFCVNHALDDQQSINIFVRDLLDFYDRDLKSAQHEEVKSLPFPPSMEDAVSPEFLSFKTILWALFQLGNSASNALTVPKRISKQIIDTTSIKKFQKENRQTIVEVFNIPKDKLAKIKALCKINKVTVTNFFAALMIFLTEKRVYSEVTPDKSPRTYRFLLSVGLRSFASKTYIMKSDAKGADYNGGAVADYTGGTVASAGGAFDFIVRIKNNLTGSTGLKSFEIAGLPDYFWDVARECRDKSADMIKFGYVQESVRLFGFGMRSVDILTAVEIAASNNNSLGREYSCGVSNVGVVDLLPKPFLDSKIKGVIGAYYGTSHSRNGVLCQLSCQTILNGDFYGCLQFPQPIISRKDASDFRNELLNILMTVI